MRLACSWRTTGGVIWDANLGFQTYAAQEFCLVDLLDAECFGLLRLRPGVGTDDEGGRLGRHAVGQVPAGGLDQILGLGAGQRRERAGDDIGLPRKRSTACGGDGAVPRGPELFEPPAQLAIPRLRG